MQVTVIRVRRVDGTIENVERSGHITDAATRRKFEAATRAAGRGEIIGWELRGPRRRSVVSQRTASHGLYARDRRVCKGCGRIGDDGNCGLGDY